MAFLQIQLAKFDHAICEQGFRDLSNPACRAYGNLAVWPLVNEVVSIQEHDKMTERRLASGEIAFLQLWFLLVG